MLLLYICYSLTQSTQKFNTKYFLSISFLNTLVYSWLYLLLWCGSSLVNESIYIVCWAWPKRNPFGYIPPPFLDFSSFVPDFSIPLAPYWCWKLPIWLYLVVCMCSRVSCMAVVDCNYSIILLMTIISTKVSIPMHVQWVYLESLPEYVKKVNLLYPTRHLEETQKNIYMLSTTHLLTSIYNSS